MVGDPKGNDDGPSAHGDIGPSAAEPPRGAHDKPGAHGTHRDPRDRQARDTQGTGARGEAGAGDEEEEVRSAFTPPAGVHLPPAPPEHEHPTSEFEIPEGVQHPAARERRGVHAFTPPTGTPVVGPLASPQTPWQDRMRSMVRLPLAERPAPERRLPAAPEEPTPPAPRILDLTLRIGELLLAGGEGAEEVEAAMFGVAHAYGLDRCEPTATFTLLSITYQPSLVDAPVTLSRTVRRRGTDYTRLAAVFTLVDDIVRGELTLEECYGRLVEIRRNRHPYPGWALTAAAGLLAGAASTLVGGAWPVFALAALGAMLGDRLAWLASARGLPEFYQFVTAAMAPAAVGVGVAVLDQHAEIGFRAAAVVTGGLFALVPGRALVSGVQDGLTGYYITAAARLLEVGYLVAGIVSGVLLMLYVGVQLGVTFNPEALVRAERPVTQIGAAMLLSFSFCLLLQQERHTVLFATLNGGVAWVVFGAMHDVGGVPPVVSTIAAAGLVGLFGQLLSRYRFASSLPYITASIGPLLPGSAIYFGLLGVAQGRMDAGFRNLATAAALALAIAIGVNLGGELARLFFRRPGVEARPLLRRAAKRTRGF